MKIPKNKLSVLIPLIFGFAALGFGLLLSGCSTSSSGSDSGTLTVTMTVSPSSITVGETAVVEATVTDGTDPLPNRIVTFSASPASAGYFTPSVDTTGASGVVSSVYTALTDGDVTISAVLSGGTSHDDFSLSVDAQSHTTSGNIDLVVVPTIILADGSSTSQLTITIRDQAGDPAPDSTMVKLTAGEKFVDLDANGYWTEGVDSLVYDGNGNDTWDAIGYIPATAYVTGGAGQVIIAYTAGTEATTVYFTITVDESSGITGYAETSIQLTPDASVASIVMGADDIHLAVKRTGGMETSTIRAVGYDAYGNTVPEGITMSFIITDGPDNSDDGERLGTLSGANRRGPYVTTTNSMGQASCPISSGAVSGTIRVRAYVDTVLSNATQIMVHAGPPARIVVGAEECNVPYWGMVNETNELVALVSDIYNNPCPDSTVVYFTCDEGVVMAHQNRIEGEEGLASSTWMSYGSDQSVDDGIVMIKVETNGGTLVDSGYFINSWYPDTLWFVTWPQTLAAHTESHGFIFVEVRDLNMNYCVGLDRIKFESEFITFIEREDGDGCYSSAISNTAQGKVLKQDYSMNGVSDDGIGVIDYITARFGFSASAAVPCTLLTGMTYAKSCIIDIPSSVPTSSTTPFSVIVKDRYGNPLGDHSLTASLTGFGWLAGVDQSTNTYGEAVGFSYTSPAEETTVIINITDTDPRGQTTFNLQIKVSAE
ncbi:MAG: hypothetical protein DRP51_00185 [Candidatus Zixiibacteriota bacterium]|nr:MAG: hypothetical protein DRP51_00185 [candidate division Zixibacteria bacterium]